MDKITQVFNIKAFDAINMNADTTSEIIELQRVTCYAVQSIWSGASGTLVMTVEASNDRVNFTSVDSYSISSSSGSRLLNVEKAGYAYIRIVLDQTGGGGTLSVHVNGKAV